MIGSRGVHRVIEPSAARPHMPGYHVDEGDEGLLPWSWADRQLAESRNYWVTTRWPDGRGHLMPVWGVWQRNELWFGSAAGSRKIRNLRGGPRITAATEDATNPVVLEGIADMVTERDELLRIIDLLNAKYHTDMSVDFLDPQVNATVRVRPHWVFGLRENEFTRSPTTWRLPGA